GPARRSRGGRTATFFRMSASACTASTPSPSTAPRRPTRRAARRATQATGAAPADAAAGVQVDGLKGLLRACGRSWPQRGRAQLAAVLTALIEAADETTAPVVQDPPVAAGVPRSG